RRVAHGQGSAVGLLVVAGRGSRPVVAVFAHPAVVAGPAERIGRAFETGDLQHQLAPRRPAHAEVKPLPELGHIVLTDRQSGLGPGHREHLDIAAVEIAVDPDVVHALVHSGTLTSIVSPLLPGKSRNSASAMA